MNSGNGCAALFSSNGLWIAVRSLDKVVVLDSATGQQVYAIGKGPDTTEQNFFTAVQFSPDSKLLLTEQANGVTKIWDAATGQQAMVFAGAKHNGAYQQYPHHPPNAPYATFTPNGLNVISGSAEGSATIWDLKSGNEIRAFRAPRGGYGPVNQMSLSSNGKRLITVCKDTDASRIPRNGYPLQVASLWNMETGQFITQVKPPSPYGEEVVGFVPNHETFITASPAVDVTAATLWDGATGTIIRKFQ